MSTRPASTPPPLPAQVGVRAAVLLVLFSGCGAGSGPVAHVKGAPAVGQDSAGTDDGADDGSTDDGSTDDGGDAADGSTDDGGSTDTGPADTGGDDGGLGLSPDPLHPLGDDADSDGVPNGLDCAPFDRAAYPGAPEACGDGVVNDCDRRRETGWSAELCERVIEPEYKIYASGSGHKELAGLGDLRGDGGFTLGLGVPAASRCDEVGVAEDGTPITDCYSIGGLYMLELAALVPSRGAIYLPDPGAPGVLGLGGHQRGRTYGSSLEGLGDFDGDGYDDFILGNDQQRSDEADEVWLFWGPSPTASLSEGVQLIQGDDWTRCIGYDMERAGDLTGDGVDDLVVGDPCADEVWVMSGAEVRTATGPSLSPAARVLEMGAERILFGMGVNGTADLTGDGLADLVASAPWADSPNRYSPDLDFVGVYEGPLIGDSDAADAVFTVRSVLAWADGSGHAIGYTLDVGDLNGDGYGDLVVADPERYEGSASPSRLGLGKSTFVFYGPLSGEALDIEADAIVHHSGAHDLQAHTDFDGDGRDDLLAAAGIFPREVAFSTSEGAFGEAYLMYSPFTGTTRLREDADVIFSCAAVREGCEDFGSQVEAVPDQTGDGVPDVVVGNYDNQFWLFAVPLPVR